MGDDWTSSYVSEINLRELDHYEANFCLEMEPSQCSDLLVGLKVNKRIDKVSTAQYNFTKTVKD